MNGLGVEVVPVVIILGLAVREATQLLIEGFKLEKRGPKVLISLVLSVAGAGLVHLCGWQQWSEQLVGAIWSAAWLAHKLSDLGNGGVLMEFFRTDDEGK